MSSIALITAHARFPWFRQIPGGRDTIDGVRFTLGSIAPDCALMVVYDDPGAVIETDLPRERRLLILTEPLGFKTYHKGFCDQFGMIMGPVPVPGYSGRVITTHPALSWFYGVGFTKDGLVANETVDSLLAMPPPEKMDAVSAVISTKTNLPMHRARLAFVKALQDALGDRLHLYGRGFRPIEDKADAIRPYAYHLVLENNEMPHFWTEKTADAFLGWSLPIFSGCANLDSYFDARSFVPVDVTRQDEAIATVCRVLEQGPYASRLEAIGAARRKILTEYNLFTVLRTLVEEPAITVAPARGGTLLIQPNARFAPFAGLRDGWKALRRAIVRQGRS